MKWMGLGVAACALSLTVACNGRDRDTSDDQAELRSGTSEAVGTSGQVDHAQEHGATGDARWFTEQAGFAGNAEVKLGQLAGMRAQNAEVKQFAEMMVRDHTKAGNELKQAVGKYNVNLPPGLDAKHQQLMERLSTLKGAEFDREYMKAMVDGHTTVEKMLEMRVNQAEPVSSSSRNDRGTRPAGTSGTAAGATGLDAAVTDWARKALPTVEQHLQKAQQIAGRL